MNNEISSRSERKKEVGNRRNLKIRENNFDMCNVRLLWNI